MTRFLLTLLFPVIETVVMMLVIIYLKRVEKASF